VRSPARTRELVAEIDALAALRRRAPAECDALELASFRARKDQEHAGVCGT